MEIIIEEISRGQKLLHRHQLNKSTVRIGRDYNNDIILSDPHICPQHLDINFNDGVWTLTDKNTINGTFLENASNKKQSANQHIIEDGDIINLGKSQLRIVFRDHKVAPTVPFSAFENLIDLLRSPIALTLSIAIFIMVAGGVFYLNNPIESNLSQLLVSAIGMSLLFGVWPAAVALVSHLTKNDARVMAQLGVSFALFNLMWLSDLLENIVAFNTASHSVMLILINLVPIALTFTLLWLNSYIGFHMTAKRRMVTALGLTVLLFGGGYLVQYSNKPEFDPHPNYNATIMDPSFLLAPSSSVDDFVEQSKQLFIDAEKSIQEEE
ncbi:FHA domain-containing protein [Colwellia sp. D2M02]|uniref:FHA domain-containing protein n=1 Tax=Colwellia sp. D2M02 TaxID=2841562 RepID=UPI001C092379|nr:FHA domain-containing protein [Colwellia sp. D2M02]MBU2892819.1 FHA domain-containing protein [Colwellia sp. D2M02]